MWTYYRDVTLYGLAVCLFSGLASYPESTSFANSLLTTVMIFGIFGTGLGVLAFGYFQKQQYYMFYNLGFTKRFLILRVWMINFGVACVLAVPILVFL